MNKGMIIGAVVVLLIIIAIGAYALTRKGTSAPYGTTSAVTSAYTTVQSTVQTTAGTTAQTTVATTAASTTIPANTTNTTNSTAYTVEVENEYKRSLPCKCNRIHTIYIFR